MEPNFTPQPTPFLSPSQGGNPYVPQGQLGNPISQGALPLPMTPIGGGTAWANNTYGYNTTPNYSLSPSQVQPSFPNQPPIPQPVPTPSGGQSNGPWNNYGQGSNNLSGRAAGANVGDVRNGYRWTGQQWEPLGGYGGGQTEQERLAQLMGQVNESYGQIENTLGATRGRYNYGANPDILNQYQTQFGAPFTSQVPLVQQSLARGQAQLGLQQSQQDIQNANALAQAKELYNEYTRGTAQRYGGGNPNQPFGYGSSAGEFGAALNQRELQRNIGQVGQTYGQNTQNIQTQQQNIQQQANAQLQSLEQQRQGAFAQARQYLDDRLSQIDQMQVQAGESKAALKLGALQGLQQQVAQIDAQFQLTQQQIQGQLQAAGLQAAGYASAFGRTALTPAQIGQYAPMAYSQYGQGGAGQYNIPQIISGNYLPGRQYDIYGNIIS